jgi:hypothetical protein
MSLEDAIRHRVKQGRLSHLTLAPTGRDEWMAAFKDVRTGGYNCITRKDPIQALTEALGAKERPAKPQFDDEDLI